MKALSMHPYWAEAVACGGKVIECRTWDTDYRGPLVICSSGKKLHDTISGHALCVVELVNVREFTEQDLYYAAMLKRDLKPNTYAWELTNNRLIVPVPVKGKLSLWDYDGPLDYIDPAEGLQPNTPYRAKVVQQDGDVMAEWERKYWLPLYT